MGFSIGKVAEACAINGGNVFAQNFVIITVSLVILLPDFNKLLEVCKNLAAFHAKLRIEG